MSYLKAASKLFRYVFNEILPWGLLISTSLGFVYLFYVGISSCFESEPNDEEIDRERESRPVQRPTGPPEDDGVSLLKKKDLKIGIFKKDNKYDLCSICYENFEETSKLCILPCDHAFHPTCVAPWFRLDHITCPNCRQVVPSLREARSEAEYNLLNNYTLDAEGLVPNILVCDECLVTCRNVIQNIEYSSQLGFPIKVVLSIKEKTRRYFAHLSRGELIFSHGLPIYASTVSLIPISADFLDNCQYDCLQDSLEEYEMKLAEEQGNIFKRILTKLFRRVR